jgi:hypothetical protein
MRLILHQRIQHRPGIILQQREARGLKTADLCAQDAANSLILQRILPD